MASQHYEQAYEVATDAVEETGHQTQSTRLIGVGLGVGFLLGLILTGGHAHRG